MNTIKKELLPFSESSERLQPHASLSLQLSGKTSDLV